MRAYQSVVVVPYAVSQALHIEAVHAFVRVVALYIVLQTFVVAVSSILLLVVLVHVVHVVLILFKLVLLVVFLHHFAVDGVVDLEAFGFDLLLPIIVMDLDVVEDGVD